MSEIIAPIMIVCGERYANVAAISINSFLKYHNEKIFVVLDNVAKNILSYLPLYHNEKLCMINIDKYVQFSKKAVNHKKFTVIENNNDGQHDRTYSALKIIIMDKVIKRKSYKYKYILSLDADTIFTGNILKRTEKYLNAAKHEIEVYMIKRDDPRMQMASKSKQPGSGFTLWKKKKPIHKFIYNKIQ